MITNNIPKHIAIIMDGNGRWAQAKGRPRVFGHKNGVESVRAAVRACTELGVEMLTLFAFSSENWRRPEEEVSYLMELFMMALNNEVKKLHKNGIKLNIIGDISVLSEKLQNKIQQSIELTQSNTALQLNIAVNYGGRWDIVQAANKAVKALAEKTYSSDEGLNCFSPLVESDIESYLELADKPQLDLMIRTGGEQRISNFLLWQAAYSELYFTETLWPDFRESHLQEAIVDFQQRERRFGKTGIQIKQEAN
jgi:undecaprenyl diphosphate synthase